jgi:hypothetical protein
VIVPFTRKREFRGLKEPTLSGHKLQLTTEVRYFEHTMDKRLAWKAQLESVNNKAYRAFSTCMDTFSKIWSLKPSVLYWICTMVIRSILTFGSMAWWPWVRYFCRMHLIKLQRLACLTINGAMTTPTVVMKVLLGFPHLRVIIGVELQPGIYRLMGKHQSNIKSSN